MPRTRRVPTILTTDDLKKTVAAYEEFTEFAFDTETVGDNPLDPRTNVVTWISLAGPNRTDVIPMQHHDGPEQLWPSEVFDALEPLFFSDRRKVGHNVKFDLHSIAKYYDDTLPLPPYGDTIVAAHLIDENITKKELGILVNKHLGYTYDKKIGKKIGKTPFDKVAHYSYLDARYTWLLWCRYNEWMKAEKVLKVFKLDMDVLEVTLAMEAEGAVIDLQSLADVDRALKAKIEDIEARLYQYNGAPFNLHKTTDKGHFVYKVRKHKAKQITAKKMEPSVKKAVLEPLADKDPAVRLLLDWATVDKLYGTYVKGMGSMVHNGRLHANFKLHGTVTGRLSCADPNLQNIPTKDEIEGVGSKIRDLFIAPPGHKLIVADYSQVEYRVLAHYCQDPKMIKAFLDGHDFHQATAATLFKKPLDKVSSKERSIAKNVNFAIVYGAGPDRVASMSGVHRKEAEEILHQHQLTFPAAYKFNRRVLKECRRQRPPHVRTILGRKRRVPPIMAEDFKVRSRAERQAINTVVQGSAADIMKLAMVHLYRTLPEEAKPIIQVHDELVVVVPEERADEVSLLVKEGMESVGASLGLTVPLVVDAKVCSRWSEGKD